MDQICVGVWSRRLPPRWAERRGVSLGCHGRWDDISLACKQGGKEIAVFGEVERYHWSEHDQNAIGFDKLNSTPPLNLGASYRPPLPPSGREACIADGAAKLAPGTGGQFETVMFSCHDSGWVSDPGNKLQVRGSRASLGYQGIFSWRIALIFSGEEFNNEPEGLPALQKGLYAGGSCCTPTQRASGGWSYGTQLDLASTDPAANATRAAMLDDTRAMLAIVEAEADLLHRDTCDPTTHALPWLDDLRNLDSLLVCFIP